MTDKVHEAAEQVSTDVAIADARYVLTWLLQCDAFPQSRVSLPSNIRELAQRAVDNLAAHARPDDGELVDEAWLRSVGFKRKKYQGSEPLALKISGGPVADPQWIETTELDGAFLLCRWSPMYDDDTPPDRISVVAHTRGQLRRLCESLGIPLTPSSAAAPQ